MRKASNISEESSGKCREKKALVEEFLKGEGSSLHNQIDFMTACIKLDSLLNTEKVSTAFLNQVSSGLISITNVKGDDLPLSEPPQLSLLSDAYVNVLNEDNEKSSCEQTSSTKSSKKSSSTSTSDRKRKKAVESDDETFNSPPVKPRKMTVYMGNQENSSNE